MLHLEKESDKKCNTLRKWDGLLKGTQLTKIKKNAPQNNEPPHFSSRGKNLSTFGNNCIQLSCFVQSLYQSILFFSSCSPLFLIGPFFIVLLANNQTFSHNKQLPSNDPHKIVEQAPIFQMSSFSTPRIHSPPFLASNLYDTKLEDDPMTIQAFSLPPINPGPSNIYDHESSFQLLRKPHGSKRSPRSWIWTTQSPHAIQTQTVSVSKKIDSIVPHSPQKSQVQSRVQSQTQATFGIRSSETLEKVKQMSNWHVIKPPTSQIEPIREPTYLLQQLQVPQ